MEPWTIIGILIHIHLIYHFDDLRIIHGLWHSMQKLHDRVILNVVGIVLYEKNSGKMSTSVTSSFSNLLSGV